MRNLIRSALASLGLVIVALATGCATPAQSDNMTIRAADATRDRQATPEALKANIALRDVTGGKETNALWVSNVGSRDFERALEESLRAVGMLAAHKQAGRYQLIANLDKLDQPLLGFDMTVTATVTYLLVERASGKTVWQKTLPTPYTAKMSDAFAGYERLRLANEGAVRQNITQLVQELLRLKAADIAVR
jgi:hypothetical protein